MHKLRLTILLAIAGWLSAADWPMPGGNPQRNNWAGSERQVTKANVAFLKLLYRFQPDSEDANNSLSAPVVVGNLITYRGFKEMLLFTGSSGNAYSVDADLNKLIWKGQFQHAAACGRDMTAPLITAGSSSSALRFAALASLPPAPPGAPSRPRYNPYVPPLSETLKPFLPTTLTRLNALYTVSADGMLHIVNSSLGDDLIPPAAFVPAGSRISGLTVRANVVYAIASTCEGKSGLYAIDLMSPEKAVHSFMPASGGFGGSDGVALGDDGTVYVAAAYAPEGKKVYQAIVELGGIDLKVKDYFIPGGKEKDAPQITPAVFPLAGRDVIVVGGANGRIYLLDSKSIGGANHKTPLFQTKPIAKQGLRGAFTTWLDVDTGIRRIYAPVAGGLRKERGLAVAAGSDAIVAFALAGQPEKPALEPLWAAGGLAAPAPAIVAARMVFVLSAGKAGAGSNLQVFDAVSGKSLLNLPAAAPASPSLAFANGRLYFTGRDNAVYCFGIPEQQTQLTIQ